LLIFSSFEEEKDYQLPYLKNKKESLWTKINYGISSYYYKVAVFCTIKEM